MFIYVEYISRRAGVSKEAFYKVAIGVGVAGWDAANPEKAVLRLGRTWRLGPEPEYIVVWCNRDADLGRIEELDRIIKSGDQAKTDEPFHLAARVDSAGLYEALEPPVVGAGGPYYVEYFKPSGDPSVVRAAFACRVKEVPQAKLRLLIQRIGLLGPEPGGLAVWEASDWEGVLELGRAGATEVGPAAITAAGIYEDIGREEL